MVGGQRGTSVHRPCVSLQSSSCSHSPHAEADLNSVGCFIGFATDAWSTRKYDRMTEENGGEAIPEYRLWGAVRLHCFPRSSAALTCVDCSSTSRGFSQSASTFTRSRSTDTYTGCARLASSLRLRRLTSSSPDRSNHRSRTHHRRHLPHLPCYVQLHRGLLRGAGQFSDRRTRVSPGLLYHAISS